MFATLIYLLALLALLLLNAFFVLSEFALVKLRSSQLEEMVDRGEPGASVLSQVHEHLDEYLSVCQLGITFASIGLGFVGEPALAKMIRPLFSLAPHASAAFAHGFAIAISYILISFLHILIGELVPKSIAIRLPGKSALRTVRLLQIFRTLFLPALVLLNSSANGILWLLGFRQSASDARHSEDEIRIILARSQALGMMSFRRLLFLENVFDLGSLRIKNVMRGNDIVKFLRTDWDWQSNFKTIQESRFSRFPLLEPGATKPLGIIHVKDLLLLGTNDFTGVDLRKIARSFLSTTPTTKVEDLLANMQRRRQHVAVVVNETDHWIGFVTLEDLAEQVLGAVEDEFARDPQLSLSEALNPNRIILNVQAKEMQSALQEIIWRVPKEDLPRSPEIIFKSLMERESAATTDLGQGLAIPHARLANLDKPVLIFARTERGVSFASTGRKRIYLFFILLTPIDKPQVQVRFLSRIAHLLESEFVEERLRKAQSAHEILDAIQSGETSALTQ